MSQIRETKLNPVPIQTGYGVPSHLSPAGSLYFDFNTGIEYQNKDGVNTWVQFFDAANKQIDVYVTGGTYDWNTGIATFVNNTGGTFTLFGFNVGGGGGGTFTGGTIVGGANFLAGLTSTTITTNSISATTYYGLPTDIRVTGGTYSNGTASFTNNTGGTFNVTGFYTGYTAPIDVYVTGSTYSNNTFTFRNNTGGTFNVSFNTVTGLTATTISANTITTPSVNANSNGLTATTVSATTYYNLPTDIRVTGGTYSSGSAVFTNNTGGTFTVSGFTTPSSLLGTYLPLSGGTVFGNTIFTSGLTANTLNITNYIDFNTGTTNPTPLGGRVFFDNGTKSLSYYDVLGNNVPIAMGQQLYTRVYNATGSQIDKGKVIAITGTSNGLPSAILAVNTHGISSARPIGLAAENIANNSEGLVLNNGILSGITVNTFSNGDTLYLSDKVAGGYVATTSSLSFTARTNEIGYVLQTGSTTGKIYVNINNEDSNLSLTDIERNILEGNVISTGTYEYSGLTRISNTLFSIAPLKGWVVKNTYEYSILPDVTNIIYSGTTGITTPYLTTADATYVLITSAATVSLQSTFPTPQERRQNIYLGKVVHPNRSTILNVNNTVDFEVSPMSALRDMWTSFKLINVGIIPSANGANLNINTSAGTLWGNGIGWVTNQLNPNSVSLSGKSPASFAYRTQTGGTSTETTTIDTLNYDVGGVITNIPGAGNFTTQRIYQFPTGLIRIQYAQHYYPTLAKALAELPNETFVEYSNNRDNAILIGYLTVKDGATDLSNTNDAIFTLVSKFGEALGGTAGLSTTTLQQAYNNSTTPEIIINATLDGLTIQNGTGNSDNITHLLEGQNTAGFTTSFITAAGGFSGSSVSAVTITTPSVTANANGLTASTISATTYQNLPTDIRTTGATYSNNTFTFTNNTGGTYNVFFNTLSGLTVNGNLSVTGNTSLQALTATTISATTYQNLPTDIRITGGTYSNNTFTYTNNTGGTYNVLFNTLTGLTVNGNLTITGNTSARGLTATTISATTYQNIPIKYYAEFSTPPTNSPVVFSAGSISIGDGAESRSTYMLSLGQNSGRNATGTTYCNFIGVNAGYDASGSTYCNFIGPGAGYGAINTFQSSFIGSSSGFGSTGVTQSYFLGYESGRQSVNLNNSNVFGYQAGYNVTNATYVNFFGNQAGYQATNAQYSNFIGFAAGTSATNAQYSNFIGANAGLQASSASYSTFIGYNAGKYFIGNNVGSNNIIIGTNISLPSGTTNSLNIGGVLFGTGLYSNIGGNPSITSVGGKIGINVVNPTNALDVGGSLLVTGTTYLGNGTFTKAGTGTGDVLLDNNTTDTPGILFYYANNSNYGIDSWNGSYDVLSGQLLRFTNKLNETGGAVKAAIDTSGNMAVGGFIKANAWRAGQVINDIMLSNTEVTISTTTIATSTSDTDFLTYSYTPLSSTSYLVIHYHLADYRFDSGTGNDSYFSRIKVDGAEITYSRQSTVNGNRSGVLFPLTGRYTNSNTTAKSIVVACRRDSADDNITITNSSTSMWLRITEIGR